jgi:large subunit ribosomal protein L21
MWGVGCGRQPCSLVAGQSRNNPGRTERLGYNLRFVEGSNLAGKAGMARRAHQRAARASQDGQPPSVRARSAVGRPAMERSDMYAVIKTGGKQYKVAAGEKIKVEQIAADIGQEVVIDQVLAVGHGADLKVGNPLVDGASVKATVVAQGKHDKVHIFKMRRRKHYRKSQGHRQPYTELQISAVNA